LRASKRSAFADPFDPTPLPEHAHATAGMRPGAAESAAERAAARGLRLAARDGALPSAAAAAVSPPPAAPVRAPGAAASAPGGSRRRPRAVVHSSPHNANASYPGVPSARRSSARREAPSEGVGNLSARRAAQEQRPWSGNHGSAG
jgi:hypothetical protein